MEHCWKTIIQNGSLETQECIVCSLRVVEDYSMNAQWLRRGGQRLSKELVLEQIPDCDVMFCIEVMDS
jgi:hypothetical protein